MSGESRKKVSAMRFPLSLSSIIVALVAAAGLSLAACTGATTGAGAASESPAGLETAPLTVTMGARVHRFTVEVARSESEQARGLMQRASLAPDRGMIFPFPAPKFASFWMKDTLIPLDILFVRADGTIDRIAENTVPLSEEPINSGGEVAMVLELAGGTAARLGIDESATVSWVNRPRG